MIIIANSRMFALRAVISFFIIMSLLLSSVVRVAVITAGDYIDVADEQSKYRINISRLRGTVYDCNMVPLTNNSERLIAAVLPNPRGVTAIKSCAKEDMLSDALDTLKSNKAVICDVDKEIGSDGIAFEKIYEQSPQKLSACHLIGYTDSTGHGVSGLQKAYDDFLYSDKFLSAVFTKDGKGNYLDGVQPYFENDLSVINSGVVTTLNINVQNIVEEVATQLDSGCVIVSDASSGKIRAMASVPDFDIGNIGESLNKSNSPMINRAITPYSVGSVFKPAVAAVATDFRKNDLIFNCEGSKEIGGRKFRCHNINGHGEMNLCDAIAHSCNCYFYNLAQVVGGADLYKMASCLNLDSKIKLADNLYTIKGKIPSIDSLKNEGSLANFSIGQGELITSPVALLNLYQALAGDGSYYTPSVVEKTIKDGVQIYYDFGEKTRIIDEKTALKLQEYLKSVITEGTGGEAMPALTTAAGKTATAQTGRYYENGEEITNSWFCGFFPADKPSYVVIVMSEGRSQVTTAKIFAQIADKITELTDISVENND